MDAVDRIFTLLDASGLEQQEFARRIGCTKAKVSQWKTTGLKSYTKYLPQIAAVLGTTVGYLLTGEREKENQTAAPEGNGLIDEFAKLFVRLTPEKQNEIIAEMLKRQQPDK